MPDFDDDEYESFDLEDSGDDSDAEADAVDLDGSEDDDLDGIQYRPDAKGHNRPLASAGVE